MLVAAAISVPLSLVVALCLAVRRCRRRGRGPAGREGRPRAKDWGVGGLLGRNKDGFKPLDTEERDGMLEDDSDSEVTLATIIGIHITPSPHNHHAILLAIVTFHDVADT